MTRRRAALALLVDCLLLACGGICAAEGTARLEWARAPEAAGCIDADDLARAAERLLGRPVFQGTDAALLIRGTVGREAAPGGRWIARLTMVAGDRTLGARELTSPAADCRALDDSLAVVLALMVDFDREHVIIAVPAVPPPPPETPSPPPRWRVDAVVGIAGSSGLLPGLVFGPTAGVSLRAPRAPVAFDLGASVLLPTAEQTDPSAGNYGTHAWAVLASAALCPGQVGHARVAVDGCVRLDAGRYQARGVGFDVARDASGPLVDGAVGARLWVHLTGGLTVRLGLDAAIPLVHNRFTYANPSGTAILFESAALAPRAELAVVMTPGR